MFKKLLQKLFPEPLSRDEENRIWDEKQEKRHDEIEKETGIRPLKWRPNEYKSKG